MTRLTVVKTPCPTRAADRYTVACNKHAGPVSMMMQFEIDHFLLVSGKINDTAIEGLLARSIIAYQEAADCDCDFPEGLDGATGARLASKILAFRSNGITRSTRHEREEVYMPASTNGGGEEPVGDLVKALESIPDPRFNRN